MALRAQHGSPRHVHDLDRAAALEWFAAALEAALNNFMRYSHFVHDGFAADGDPDDDRPLVAPRGADRWL